MLTSCSMLAIDRRLVWLVVLACATSGRGVGTSLNADEPLLRANDRLAILGGTFVERMQSSGVLEATLHGRRPEWKLSIRNLGWSGDDVHGIARKVFGDHAKGFERLVRDVQIADPSVVLVAYGFAQAGDGPEAVDRFGPGLRKLIDELKSKTDRVLLVTPVAMPGYRVDSYQASMQKIRGDVVSVGNATDTPVIEIDWQPQPDELTKNQLVPNDQGYAAFADQIAVRLVGDQESRRPSDDLYRLISEKNQLFFHRYRPQNETYLYLFRKHEQGNNAVEIDQFEPLIQAADQSIWSTALAN